MVSRNRKKHSTRQTALEKRFEEMEREGNAPYLRAFFERCVRNFDVKWICEQILRNQEVPTWYRSILTRVLVGWVIWPKNKKFRNALVWHHINDQFHIRAQRAWKAQKDDKKNAAALLPYFVHLSTQILIGRLRYKHLYLPLGGLNSKRHESLDRLLSSSSKQAKAGKLCLQLIDVLAYLHQRKANTSFGNGKAILQDYSEQYRKDGQYLYDSNSKYDLPLIAQKNFEKLWADAQPTAEFLAALYCTEAKLQVQKPAAKGIHEVHIPIKALDAIIGRGLYNLPFSSEEFQKELIGRAKHFSTLLEARKKIGAKSRFPDGLAPIPSQLNIFSKGALESKVDAAPGTKRMITSRRRTKTH